MTPRTIWEMKPLSQCHVCIHANWNLENNKNWFRCAAEKTEVDKPKWLIVDDDCEKWSAK